MENNSGIFESSIQRFNIEDYMFSIKLYVGQVYSASIQRRDVFTKENTSKLMKDDETLYKMAIVCLKNDIDDFLKTAYRKEGTEGQIEKKPKWITEHISKGFKMKSSTIPVTKEEAEKIGNTPYDEMRKKLYDIAGFEYTSKEELMRMYKESGATSPSDMPDELRRLFNKNGLILNYDEEIELNPKHATSYLNAIDGMNLEKFNKEVEEYYPDIIKNQKRKR